MRIGTNELIIIFLALVPRLLMLAIPVIMIYWLARIARNLEKPPKMTQEFVAESIGVSRQAVSKWENGTSEPNTSNLVALAKLYGISAEDLLKGVENALEAQKKE